MSSTLHFEDLTVGRVFRTASVEVTADEITRFAARYDPQPFHLDPVAARKTVFGGLVSSGWLTAALTMRLMMQSEFQFGEGVVGLGVDQLRWPKPVWPGDTLTATVEVTSVRPSSSKPEYGVVQIMTTTRNQRDESVQSMITNVMVKRRSQP